MIGIAEDLVDQFRDLTQREVIRVITDCLREFPDDSPHFIRHAAQARLSALRRSKARDG
jgi:hypothetical protein